MFQTAFLSIIRSSKQYIQCQVFVRPLLLPAASLARLAAGSSNCDCVLNSHLKRVTIPDIVLTQFYLLKMNIIVLETCRGIY